MIAAHRHPINEQLNFVYCHDYIKRIEANEQINFDIEKANIILNSSKICCMALDMTSKKKVSYQYKLLFNII